MATILGGSFIASVVSDEVYDPVFDTEMDAELIYQLLPSFYRTVMQDQEIFSTVWSGVLQNSAADLLNLWQVDYAKSLRDVPVLSQRKWVKLDLFREEDFGVDPGLSNAGLATAFVYDLENQNLSCVPTNRARWDKAFIQLTGTEVGDFVDETTSLAWSVDVNIESVETFGGLLFGYFGTSPGQLSHTIATAILGDQSAEDTPYAAILHFDPFGIAAVSIDSFVLEIGKDYRFDATYTAGTGAIVLSIVELRYSRLTSSTGEVPEALNSVYTNQFVDQSVNFDAEGVLEGDILIAFNTEYTIVSVDGSVLTVTPIGLPVDVTNVSYEIQGEEEVSSLSMDLPGDAAQPTFSVGQFGVSSLDSRSINTLIYPTPSLARKRGIAATVDNWRYLDPTSSDTILSLPRLQDVITDPQELLYEGTDYVVEVFRNQVAPEAFSVMRFQEPPLEPLWAEYVGYDEQHIRKNFGVNVGLEDISSDIYKARVRGLYYAYFQGPTLNAIRTGVHILIGLPIADVAGEVESINPVYSGTLGLITVAGRDYLYPLAVGTDLQVGDQVDLFEPLSRGVEITDYVTDPEWFVPTDLHELQKFHHFRVSLNLDAFELESLDLAGQFVDQIKPTWKQVRYLVFKELSDTVDITDVLTVGVALNLYDPICDQFVVAYDDAIYEGEEPDWKYSQGLADWDETSAAMRGTSTPLVGIATLTNSALGANGNSTLWLTDIAPSLPNAYVAVGRYSTSNTGETTAGSLFFIDNTDGVFDNIEPNDHIVIAGEGTFEVNEIVRNVFSSGTGKFLDPTTFEDPSGTFQTDGLQPGDVLVPVGGLNDGLEFEVSSVPSETQIIILGAATPAEIDTGTGGFVGITVFESVGATWQTLGVQPGDYLVLSGGGANDGREFEIGLVVDEDQLVIIGAAILSAGETYVIERREDYTVDRENQLTLDAPLGFTNTNVTWEVTGKLKIWGEVASVVDDSTLNFATNFAGETGDYVLALLDNAYKQAFYDQFEEFCPDDWFTIELEYTGPDLGGPAVLTVPDNTAQPGPPPAGQTTFNYQFTGDTYEVTLTELTP